MLSATSSRPDPLVQPIPPASWPATVTRQYEFPGPAPRGRIETYECRYEINGPAEMVILEIRYSGVEVSEFCEGPAGSFENLHFVDSGGNVWRSLQWTGPRQGLLDLEIIEPYDG